MQNLKDQIKELERLYKFNKLRLIGIKLFILFGGFLSLAFAYNYGDGLLGIGILKKWELLEAKGILAVMVITPLLLTPLYKLFTDRVTNKINWDIKMSIFDDVLNKYQTDYHISFKGILPDTDLSFLKLNNGITKFAYGDDLIFGTINSVNFRLSEIHSINFIGKGFHGLVGVLILDQSKPNINMSSVPSTVDKSIEIVTTGNNYYLIKRKKSQLFEFSIKKNQVNKTELEEDYHLFDQFVRELNSISLILAE